jgi:hypothetical protein
MFLVARLTPPSLVDLPQVGITPMSKQSVIVPSSHPFNSEFLKRLDARPNRGCTRKVTQRNKENNQCYGRIL